MSPAYCFVYNLLKNISLSICTWQKLTARMKPSSWCLCQLASRGSLLAAAASIGVLGGTFLTYLYQKNKNKKLPKDWVQIGFLKKLYVYPIKSCGSVALNRADCTVMGLKDNWFRDRILMVIDTIDNNVLTMRSHPDLASIKPIIRKSVLILHHPKMESPLMINIAAVMIARNVVYTNVRATPVTVYECGKEANNWITQCLNSSDNPLRLVFYPSNKSRMMHYNYGFKFLEKLTDNDTGAFTDVCSYHVINQSSVDDLNLRLKEFQVSDVNFRPNIVISGCEAFDEDKWKYMKIGENIFEVIFPCFRCCVTNVDPSTGKRYKNLEPLRTLRTYRLASDPEIRETSKNDPLMGAYMALRSGPGTLAVNEPVYVAY